MIKILLAFSFLLFLSGISGQTLNESDRSGKMRHIFLDASISASPSYLLNTPEGNIFAGGLKIRMHLTKRFSFDSDLMLGYRYAHAGPGLIGIPLWYFFSGLVFGNENIFSSETYEGDEPPYYLLVLPILMLTSVEHVAYHIPFKYRTDLSPYVSLLRIKQLSGVTNSDGNLGKVRPVCFALGLEVNKYFRRFFLSPYVEYDRSYSGRYQGLNFGIWCGYYFPNK